MARVFDVSADGTARSRAATPADGPQLLGLWSLLFDEQGAAGGTWRTHAHEWFLSCVGSSTAHFPVVEARGEIAATAIGTLELGVPNPMCPRGRTVQLKNVVTRPGHRGQGHATGLVSDVVRWARMVEADRVDLSATVEGQRIYRRAGFVLTSAPRMKLIL